MKRIHQVEMKLKTENYEILELKILKDQTFDLPISKSIKPAPVVYVLEGRIQPSEGQTQLEKGKYFIIQNQDNGRNICAVENTTILLITSIKKPEEPYPLSGNDEVLNTRASYGKAIAQDILAAQPIHQSRLDALIETIKTKDPFEGDSFNVYSDLFLSIFSALPLEPLKLSKTYSAYLCAKWVKHAPLPEKAIEEVLYYIEKVYSEIFMPKIQSPIVREAIYWTLLSTGEKKSVQFIADRLYVNRTHLSERFKQLAQISLSDYILRVKMTGAMLLLIDKNLAQSDVMDILGYKDENHFVRKFKSFYNMTPNEFTKRYYFLGN